MGLTPTEASKIDCIFLDVRTKEERVICHIKPSEFIPLRELRTGWERLPKDKEIVVYCHTGARSALATAFLKLKGLRAYNLTGGIEAWRKDIDPTLAKY